MVELIIVIAIMAILIAVVALAVIPYINSAREGKAHDAVNNVQSVLKSCMAKENYAKQAAALATPVEATKANLNSKISGLGDSMENLMDKDFANTLTDATNGVDSLSGAKLYVQVKDKKCIVMFSKDGTNAVDDSDGTPFKAE